MFFLLTAVFYWIVDTNRRRTLNMTLVVCTLCLGVGSEFLQSFLPNDRDFDLFDIVANIVGSLAGLGLCSWYHKRMLERKRQRKSYNPVPGEDGEDVELGQDQVSGIIDADQSGGRTLEEEVDNWDENASDDWDEEDGLQTSAPPAGKSKEPDTVDIGDAKARMN
ncbi:VanZ-like protein [Metarhizium rileyi]|nr:VanZ-like protein [Metarhizium rileyi RCEF 4871]